MNTDSSASKSSWQQDLTRRDGSCSNAVTYKRVLTKTRREKPFRLSRRSMASGKKDGHLLQTTEEIKCRRTEYCSELYKDSPVINGMEAELEKLTPAQTEETPPLVKAEVQKAINLLKKGKSLRTNRNTAEMLQAGRDIVLEEMHKICQAVWEKEDIPKEWTKSIIVATRKKEISPNVLITEICHL
jgi:hypothetical protein